MRASSLYDSQSQKHHSIYQKGVVNGEKIFMQRELNLYVHNMIVEQISTHIHRKDLARMTYTI